MYFLVEQYRYEISTLYSLFGDVLAKEDIPLKTFSKDNLSYSTYSKDGKKYVKFDHVGFCHYSFQDSNNQQHDDWVFFLPKVVLDLEIENEIEGDASDSEIEDDAIKQSKEAKILKRYSPVKYLNAESIKKENIEDYIYLLQLSVSVSRAIGVYRKRLTDKRNKTVLKEQAISNIKAELNGRAQSFLDILSSLEKFAKENQDYFMFLSQESHNSQKRINWARTIQNTVPVFQRRKPLYLDSISTKKAVDFDEELLVLFYSILNFVNKTFQYNCPINEGYELIQGAEFTRYLQGYGHRRLQQIRYKYFTDKTLTLWKLCDEFFVHLETSSDKIKEEYILAKGFHKVFEGMMDRLVGDEDLAKKKALKDGKVIDHLYRDKSLVNPEQDLLFIADSKYYAINATIGEESRFKQFTYASGIQNEWIDDSSIRIMDKDTRGYDIIPNYLISARISDSQKKRTSSLLEPDADFNNEHVHIPPHVDNTLFNNSTKYIFKFSVDFKYVIDLYSRDKDGEISAFKAKAHTHARDFAIKYYDDLFRFFWFDKLPASHPSEKDLLVLDYKAEDKEGSPAFLIMIGRVFSFPKDGEKQYVVAVAREGREEFSDEYHNESKAIIDALLTEGYIHDSGGMIEEEHKLKDIQS